MPVGKTTLEDWTRAILCDTHSPCHTAWLLSVPGSHVYLYPSHNENAAVSTALPGGLQLLLRLIAIFHLSAGRDPLIGLIKSRMARQKTGSTSGERKDLERWQMTERTCTREMEEVGLTVWRGGNELCGRA